MTEVEKKIDEATFLSFIQEIQSELKKMPQIEIETNHYFAPGVYMREVIIPQGAVVTGRIHRHEHMNIMSKGKLRLMTPEGMQTVTAPYTVKSPPGTKRLAIAIEETVWTTVHPNPENLTDTDLLQDLLSIDDTIKLEPKGEERKCL